MEMESCIVCGEDTTWIRRTQFAGDHFFCTKCAKKNQILVKMIQVISFGKR